MTDEKKPSLYWQPSFGSKARIEVHWISKRPPSGDGEVEITISEEAYGGICPMTRAYLEQEYSLLELEGRE